MNILAIIPARMGSSRFPGKPMAKILGIPMIGHVYDRVSKSEALWGIIVPILVFGFLVKKNATEQDKYKLLENLIYRNKYY